MLRTTARIACVLCAAAPLAAASLTTDLFFDGARLSRDPSSAVIAEQPQRRAGDAETPQTNDEWCNEVRRNNRNDDRRETFCEVREFTLGGRAVSAETSNGSMRVNGESRADIHVRAIVVAHARTEAEARDIAKQITVATSGLVKATGPRTENREGWWVGFRIRTPQSADIDLTSSNGSLAVSDVRGRMKLRTSNGSIRLAGVAGDVVADTSNGSVNASLSGSKWEGDGLDVSTSNGSVRMTVPENYNARLVAGTSNGSINVGFPITVQGRIGGRTRDIDTTLGSGGAPIKIRTSNGSVSIERR